MLFKEKLKLSRKEKNITQEQLAEMLNVSRQAVSKWEQGAGYPETEKLILISQKLDVSIDYLLDEKENIKTKNEKEEGDINQGLGEFKITEKAIFTFIIITVFIYSAGYAIGEAVAHFQNLVG